MNLSLLSGNLSKDIKKIHKFQIKYASKIKISGLETRISELDDFGNLLKSTYSAQKTNQLKLSHSFAANATFAVSATGDLTVTPYKNMIVAGNLQVTGTTTTVDSSTMTVTDRNRSIEQCIIFGIRTCINPLSSPSTS